LLLFAFGPQQIFAQQPNLPKTIRGYKVQKVPVVVNRSQLTTGESTKAGPSASVEVVSQKVEIVNYSLAGVTFTLPIQLQPIGGSGKVDFVTFHDFSVGGVPVEIEEYREAFSFTSGSPITLPKPITVFVRSDRIAIAAWNELRASRPEWQITGRVFVFGRFRKFGFNFKRVVPVDVSLTITNPLRSANIVSSSVSSPHVSKGSSRNR